MPGQRIDYAEAAKMLRAGASQREVADLFGVGQAAISRAISRGAIKGIEYDRTKTDESPIPWSPIRKEHRNSHLARMLRAAARRERGDRSAPVIEAQLDLFLKDLRKRDLVVVHDPEMGWTRVPRRRGIDAWLIRDPYLADDGTSVKNPVGVKPRSESDL